MSTFSETIVQHKYLNRELGETGWDDVARRVTDNVVRRYVPSAADTVYDLIRRKVLMPGGRYLYASGRKFHQTNNCFLLRAEDSRQGWGSLIDRVTNGLMTGGGIGVDYTQLRGEGAAIRGMGGTSTGPLALMQIVNETGRHIMQGGSRRSALWAGLLWSHPDIDRFIELKNWSPEVRDLKAKDFNFPAPMDGTNISVILDDEFFLAYHNPNHPKHSIAYSVYWRVVKRMLKTGEPGFSIDVGENSGETLRNACTEVTSSDDNDVCNLLSVNLSRVNSLAEMREAVEMAVVFTLCGTLYSKVPYPEIAATRNKNRRLGIGLMGIHEWLLMNNKGYGPDSELEQYLAEYAKSTEIARVWADKFGISAPVKTRAIAPTGTISIIAETTSGIEPIFCTAFKRRYLKGNTWYYQYVVDSAAERLINKGVSPGSIEDAYMLSQDVERRIAMQSWIQKYVDHGISSTINLPAWGSEYNNENTIRTFGETLLPYLPKLRGITTYPDGARGGQPLTAVSYDEAVAGVGTEFVEYGNENACRDGVCGV